MLMLCYCFSQNDFIFVMEVTWVLSDLRSISSVGVLHTLPYVMSQALPLHFSRRIL